MKYPSNNIGRVFRLENIDGMSLYGWCLGKVSPSTEYTESVLGPNVEVRLKIPELSYDKPSVWTSSYTKWTESLGPSGTRASDEAFMARLVEVEVVDLGSAPFLPAGGSPDVPVSRKLQPQVDLDGGRFTAALDLWHCLAGGEVVP